MKGKFQGITGAPMHTLKLPSTLKERDKETGGDGQMLNQKQAK